MDLQTVGQREDGGSAEERFRLGVQMLSGSDSNRRLVEAVTLIESASAAGFAPAIELTAVFAAMGVARPRSLDEAFDRLVVAAEQGSPAAQGQLMLLAENSHDFIQPDVRRPGVWREFRNAIALERLLQSGKRIALSEAPRVRVIERFATPPECRWLIERARTRLARAVVLDPTGSHSVDPGRSNSGAEFLVLDMDVVLEVIRARISAATRVPVNVFELTQILHYSVGEEFKPHYDFLDPANSAYDELLRSGGQRIATFLIYLNEEFEGGETAFPRAGLRYRGNIGDAIFWANLDMEGRPDPFSIHAGLPPTSGEKWILSQWIRDLAAASE